MGLLYSRIGTDKYYVSYEKSLQKLKDDTARMKVRVKVVVWLVQTPRSFFRSCFLFGLLSRRTGGCAQELYV